MTGLPGMPDKALPTKFEGVIIRITDPNPGLWRKAPPGAARAKIWP